MSSLKSVTEGFKTLQIEEDEISQGSNEVSTISTINSSSSSFLVHEVQDANEEINRMQRLLDFSPIGPEDFLGSASSFIVSEDNIIHRPPINIISSILKPRWFSAEYRRSHCPIGKFYNFQEMLRKDEELAFRFRRRHLTTIFEEPIIESLHLIKRTVPFKTCRKTYCHVIKDTKPLKTNVLNNIPDEGLKDISKQFRKMGI